MTLNGNKKTEWKNLSMEEYVGRDGLNHEYCKEL